MKIKRTPVVPKVHRRPARLSDLSDLLFPHSPITVENDFTTIAGEKVFEWHIYVEGEWFDKEGNLPDLAQRLYEIIESQGEDWDTPSTRVNPTWGGWDRITPIDLNAMSLMCYGLRENNLNYYSDE